MAYRSYKKTHREIDRQIKIQFHCAIDLAPQNIRDAYLSGWLDSERLSGRKANPDKFKTLFCEDCGHRKENHIPNKIRQDAGYAVCLNSYCECNRIYGKKK